MYKMFFFNPIEKAIDTIIVELDELNICLPYIMAENSVEIAQY